MSTPFYVASQNLYGKDYACRYFRSKAEAENDCREIPGAYAIAIGPQTSGPDAIWRSTVPE